MPTLPPSQAVATSPSRPRGCHPEPLPDPARTRSRHPARAPPRGTLPPAVEPMGGLLGPVAPLPTRGPTPGAPWACPRCGAPPQPSAPARRIGTCGLTGLPLVPFPCASPCRCARALREPACASPRLPPGPHLARQAVPALLRRASVPADAAPSSSCSTPPGTAARRPRPPAKPPGQAARDRAPPGGAPLRRARPRAAGVAAHKGLLFFLSIPSSRTAKRRLRPPRGVFRQ